MQFDVVILQWYFVFVAWQLEVELLVAILALHLVVGIVLLVFWCMVTGLKWLVVIIGTALGSRY